MISQSVLPRQHEDQVDVDPGPAQCENAAHHCGEERDYYENEAVRHVQTRTVLERLNIERSLTLFGFQRINFIETASTCNMPPVDPNR